jgi:dipeptidyl aminopeptidase/acylaminoacyl peptidase
MRRFILLFITLNLTTFVFAESNIRPLKVEDIMKFRQIENQVISKNGEWLALTAEPDRGDSEGFVYGVNNNTTVRVERGINPQISDSGSFILFEQALPFVKKENLEEAELKKQIPNWVLVNTRLQTKTSYEMFKKAKISQNGEWIALLEKYQDPNADANRENKSNTKKEQTPTANSNVSDDNSKNVIFKLKDEHKGATLKIINLISQNLYQFEQVIDFEFSHSGKFLALVEGHNDGLSNQVKMVDLVKETSDALIRNDFGTAPKLVWHTELDKLAFNWGNLKLKEKERQLDLYLWEAKESRLKQINWENSDWSMKTHNSIRWDKQSKYIYFGLFPDKKIEQWKIIETEVEKKDKTEQELLDSQNILEDRGLTIWHGKDSYIKPHEKKLWEKHEKHDYWFVTQTRNLKTQQLANENLFTTELNIHNNVQLFEDNLIYARERSYVGYLADVYAVNVDTGKKQLLAKKIHNKIEYSISPNGQWFIYFKDGNYQLTQIEKNSSSNLTKHLKVSFADELHDYPGAPPPYGIAGWSKDNRYAYLYDRYDIWQVKLSTGRLINLTNGIGRKHKQVLRRVHTDSEQPYIVDNNNWLVKGYFDEKKNFGFYNLDINKQKLKPLLVANKAYKFVIKAKNNQQILFTEEDFQQFPDIWVANQDFSQKHQITDINPQISEFSWGQKPQLIEWKSTKGKPLKGVLIKPHGYKEGDRVPVIVYYYRYYSQRMYLFNRMEINHRPNFPFYTSNGYAVFLPDVVFEVGTPGASATQALVPGIQKLVDMGVADADAIGLHGHSWSGYQSAFVITQTDIFKAAVAGAPVSNMTSAYSGIRLKSGLTRQFQYEMGQSRIGGSLNEMRELYIENSPVFFADRINTPLLLMFGDIDDAVPWDQGVELYMAMRREDKDVVFLQYHDEPHHLKKYPNKVDYTLRMKAYFDYHLKGADPEQWMLSGEAYKGEKDSLDDNN